MWEKCGRCDGDVVRLKCSGDVSLVFVALEDGDLGETMGGPLQEIIERVES